MPMENCTDPKRTAEAERAIAAFYERAAARQVPRRRRYTRIGGVVGSRQHQRRKRLRQRRGW